MIKTTELMLGNIIEYKNAYVQVINLAYGDLMIRHNGVGVAVVESDINPIPLTDGVLKRLGMLGSTGDFNADEYSNRGFEYVHKLQIEFYLNPIDITPLLSPRYTTHDGVEVWEGDEVWCFEYLKGVIAVKCDSTIDPKLHFSTQQACQSYIDSATRKPIFTTEDGVDVFDGDEYWVCTKCGYDYDETKSAIGRITSSEKYESFTSLVYFSTPELAQAYLNKVWAEKEYNDLLNTPRK